MTYVECCLGNVTAEALSSLDHSGARVREALCLDRCGICFETDFLVIDGEPVTGPSHAAILDGFEASTEDGST